MFLDKDLSKYIPRKEQTEALNFIANTLKNDKSKKFFMLDLPVGVGKSLLCLYIMQHYVKHVNKHAKFDVLTNSRILQEQYVNDFNSFNNLWGTNNYNCDSYSCSCEQGKVFNKLNKSKCDNCPYDEAKDDYLNGKVSLTNFHMYILFQVFMDDSINHRKPNVLIIDESHDFESVFSDFLSINLNELQIKKLKFIDVPKIMKSLNRIQNIEEFIDFMENYFIDEIEKTKSMLKKELSKSNYNQRKTNRDLKINNILGTKSESVKNIKIINDLDGYKQKIEDFIKDYQVMPENWVMEWSFDNVDKNKKKKNKNIFVQPVWCHPYLDKYIWSKYDHVILMSGTILDKNMFSYLNGISPVQSVYYSIDSPFAVKNRPIYYMPIGRMSYKIKKDTFKRYIPYIKKIMKKYKDNKGIIHSVTYELSKWVNESVNDDRFIFHDTNSKDKAIRKHYESNLPSVMVSPSMSSGVNLEYDRARFQVLLKVPYPSLGSQRNKIRQKTMPIWYTWRTIAGIIQAYGRAIRSYDDKADFIILDGCFSDILKYSSHMIPDYITRAIKKVDINKIESERAYRKYKKIKN